MTKTRRRTPKNSPKPARSALRPGTPIATELTSPVLSDPVQRQLDAYNARDLEAFISCYAADVVVAEPDGTPMITGHPEVRIRYGALFARPGILHAEVPHRVRAGSWTVDHEHLVSGDLQMEALVAYQVHDGLISRVVILR